jgi:hypothetical protein
MIMATTTRSTRSGNERNDMQATLDQVWNNAGNNKKSKAIVVKKFYECMAEINLALSELQLTKEDGVTELAAQEGQYISSHHASDTRNVSKRLKASYERAPKRKPKQAPCLSESVMD